MKKNNLFVVFLFFITFLNYSQNTIGTIINTPNAFEGYTLFSNGNKTFLINNCGQKINEWVSNYDTMGTVYLLEDGSILRAGTTNNSNIIFGGVSGRIEKFDWEGNLIWQYEYSDNTKRLHHDFYPLQNGNILALAVTKLTNQQAINLGRNPNNLINDLYNEQIIEIQPQGSIGGNIVWQWNIQDHIIQDYDDTKANYGVISEHPEKLNINFLNGNAPFPNWLHFNSIQYNETLNQIIISSRLLSEIYIIEHSNSSNIAQNNTGGIYNAGGDFLYRWGNPQAYGMGTGTERKLFGQHHAHWIPTGYPEENKIMLFNNGFGRNPSFSEVFIIDPPINNNGTYNLEGNTFFEPILPNIIYPTQSSSLSFHSEILSSAQMLPNSNVLICDGDSGMFFEIDQNENIVWKYINPQVNSNILSQGDTPVGNIVFRARKYPLDYAAFIGKSINLGLPIEQNPELLPGCETLSNLDFQKDIINIYPNPTNDIINIVSSKTLSKIEIYNNIGVLIKSIEDLNDVIKIDISNLPSGIYLFVTENKQTSEKITKRIVKL